MENLHSGSRSRGCPAVTLRGFQAARRLVLASTVSGLALSVGMALAQEPAADSATTTNTTDTATGAGWSAHGSVTARAGTERHIGELDLFLPLWQNGNSLLYGDLRAQTDDAGNQEGNAGLGFRRMGGEWIVGGYGFFDYRLSDETGNSFMQGTLGAEALSDTLDLRANVYLPEGGEQAAPGFTALQVIGGSLQLRQGAERALPGVDGEVGYRLWGSEDGGREVRGFAGGYYFDAAEYRTVAGPRGRIEARLFDLDFLGEGSRFTLGAEVTQDNVRDTQGFASARLTIPFGGGRRSGRGGLDRRMADYVVRDVDIITAAAATGSSEAMTYVGSGVTVGNVTVFSSGDDIAAVAASGGAGDLLIVNGAIDTTATIALQDSQVLTSAGLGIEIVGVNTGTQLTYSVNGTRGIINGDVAGAAVVTLTSNAIVADIDINNTSLTIRTHGISGDTVTGASVTGSNITTAGGGDGVYLINSSNNTLSGNGITTAGDGADGVFLARLDSLGGSSTSSTANTVIGNSITTSGSGSAGIVLDGSTGNTIDGNDITTSGAGGSGVLAVNGAHLNTVTNNAVATSGDDGYGMYLNGSSGNVVDSNDIATSGIAGYGMFVANASNSNKLNNNVVATIADNGYGMYLDGSAGNVVDSNDIATSGIAGYGMFVANASNSNMFSNNVVATSAKSAYGMYLNAVSDNRVGGNSITTAGPIGYGLYLDGSTGNLVDSNDIATSGSAGHGMYVTNASNTNTFSGNSITMAGYGNGMYLLSVSGNTVSGNTIRTTGDGGYGLNLVTSEFNTISDNSITATTTGMYANGLNLYSSANNTVSNNLIVVNGKSVKGLYLYDSANNTVGGNSISVDGTANAAALFLRLSSSNVFDGNSFSANIPTGNGVSVHTRGAYLDDSDSNIFNAGNSFVASGDQGAGVFVSNSDSNVFSGVDIVTNGRISTALSLTGGSILNTIDSSSITSTVAGICLGNTASNTITNNSIATVRAGVTLSDGATTNTVSGNSITTTGSSGVGVRLLNATSNTFDNNIIVTNDLYAYGFYLGTAAPDLNTGTGNSYTGPESACFVDSSVTGTNSIDLCP